MPVFRNISSTKRTGENGLPGSNGVNLPDFLWRAGPRSAFREGTKLDTSIFTDPVNCSIMSAKLRLRQRLDCPLCGWVPRKEDHWFCECGHSWNTFDTGAFPPPLSQAGRESAVTRMQRVSENLLYLSPAPKLYLLKARGIAFGDSAALRDDWCFIFSRDLVRVN